MTRDGWSVVLVLVALSLVISLSGAYPNAATAVDAKLAHVPTADTVGTQHLHGPVDTLSDARSSGGVAEQVAVSDGDRIPQREPEGSTHPGERRSQSGTPSGISDGLDEINARDVHDLGYRGDNVTAVIIDSTGLDVDNSEIHPNLVATHDTTDYGISGGAPDSHGTKTSELLVDVAPNVDLIYIRAVTESDVHRALAWMERNDYDEDVVSMSKGFPNDAGPLDGTANLDQAISDFVANESALFVVGAGNAADNNSWHGTWNDSDGNDVLDAEEGTERFEVTGTDFETTIPGNIHVSWNDWDNATATDYRIVVHYDNGTTEIIDEQESAPYETFDTDGKNAAFEIVKEGDETPPAERAFTVSSIIHTISPSTDATSIRIPGAGRNVVTVGATVSDGTGDKIELAELSSRGPTVDGRIKPDLVAPTNVTTSADTNFGGTSAATPHVAGVVALVLDAKYARDPGDVSPADIRTHLLENANRTANYGAPDLPNNRVGYGLVDALATIEAIETTPPATTATPSLTTSPTQETAQTQTEPVSPETATQTRTTRTDDTLETSTRTNEKQTPTPTGDSGLGFTPFATILALLVLGIFGRRH